MSILIDPLGEVLIEGSNILESVLLEKGFRFRFIGESTPYSIVAGAASPVALAEFVLDDRRLHLGFAYSLRAYYSVGDQCAGHECYMRELGVWNRCRYPGYSDDPLDAFRCLAHDLTLEGCNTPN